MSKNENKKAEEWEEEIFWGCMDRNTKSFIEDNPYINIDFKEMAEDDDAIYETENGLLQIY